MTAFHTIAIPHDDILQGRYSLEVYAADLWQAAHGRGPEVYRDSALFFQKTYLTSGLQNLLDVVQKRLAGGDGDPVIQMQTPFGGGKTHSLIALYHKAREWGVKPAVISGTPLSSKDTLWSLIAEQLSGSRAGFEQLTAPGREALINLLSAHQPVLILMDEVLEYITKAAGEKVGENTLAAQTLAFMQELTEAVGMLEQAVVVIALPSSALEHYDEAATRLFEQIKKISGRVEKIFTPVQDAEVAPIIRRRLFSFLDETSAKRIANSYVEYAERESLLPGGEESASYRESFIQSYPLLPEVIEVLYHRWGGFPTFQRTRGILRLLAMVVGSLKHAQIPYISLADFDLANGEIRRELLNHVGNEYDSVIAADIISPTSGAAKVKQDIGKAYRGYDFGKRIATTIFMYSHVGGGGEGGATLAEIKRQAAVMDVPSSVIAEVLEALNNRHLFYLHESAGRYHFTTTANLNRALTVRIENISLEDLQAAELELLKGQIGGKEMKVYLWPSNPADVSDTSEPKLIVLCEPDAGLMERFLTEKGQTPRVHRNTLFFLAPLDTERIHFEHLLRRWLAIQALLEDRALALSAEQREDLHKKAKQAQVDLKEHVRRLYRQLYYPLQTGVQDVDMGIPTYGQTTKLDEEVYARLRSEGRILERLAAMVIEQRYLQGKAYVLTQQLAESSSRTRGEALIYKSEVWQESIVEGVQQGMFGLGELDSENNPQCRYFKERPLVSLQGQEVLIRSDICEMQRRALQEGEYTITDTGQAGRKIANGTLLQGQSVIKTGPVDLISKAEVTAPNQRTGLQLKFVLPQGKVSSLFNLLSFLQQRFARMDVSISFAEGKISEDEIETKVRETFHQLGVDVEIE